MVIYGVFVCFFKEYEAIYLAKLTIKMMAPMQLGRSFSLQAGVAGLCDPPPPLQLGQVTVYPTPTQLTLPGPPTRLILLRPFSPFFSPVDVKTLVLGRRVTQD